MGRRHGFAERCFASKEQRGELGTWEKRMSSGKRSGMKSFSLRSWATRWCDENGGHGKLPGKVPVVPPIVTEPAPGGGTTGFPALVPWAALPLRGWIHQAAPLPSPPLVPPTAQPRRDGRFLPTFSNPRSPRPPDGHRAPPRRAAQMSGRVPPRSPRPAPSAADGPQNLPSPPDSIPRHKRPATVGRWHHACR